MKLPIFLTGHHLKNCGQWMAGVRKACYVFTGIWTITETVSHFYEPVATWSRGNLALFIVILIICFLIGGITFILKCKKALSVSAELEKTDTSIEIRVGDIFKFQSNFIIATDTTFDTERISEDSLLGQCRQEFYNHPDHFDLDLKKALKNERGSWLQDKECYDFGTVAKITPKERTIYMVAIDNLNEDGGATSSLEFVRQSLTKLWKYIGKQRSPGHLVIPIIGTKSAGFQVQVPRDIMITEIIKSVISATYSEPRFCETLTIVIHEQDYRRGNIDLRELGNYLRTHAKQKKWEISEPKEPVGVSIPEDV